MSSNGNSNTSTFEVRPVAGRMGPRSPAFIYPAISLPRPLTTFVRPCFATRSSSFEASSAWTRRPMRRSRGCSALSFLIPQCHRSKAPKQSST